MEVVSQTSSATNKSKEFNPDAITPYELFGYVMNIMKGQHIHKKRPGLPRESRVSVLLEESLKQNEKNGLMEKTMNAFTIPDNDDRSLYRKMIRVALLLHPDIDDSQNLLLNTMFWKTGKSAIAGLWISDVRLAHYLLGLPELKEKENDVKKYVLQKRGDRYKSPINEYVPAKFTRVIEHPTLTINGRKTWITKYDKEDLHNRFRVLQYLKDHEELMEDDRRDISTLDTLLPLWKGEI